MKRYSTGFKIAILFLLVGGVIGFIAFRFQQIHTMAKLERFYKNASQLFQVNDPSLMGGQEDEQLKIMKQQTGDLLPMVKHHFLSIPNKYYLDPFNPPNELPLHFGRVEHSSEIHSNLYDPNAPVWFTFSSGPSREKVEFTISEKQEIPSYRFTTSAYAMSNGVYSKGYIFSDSMGTKVGR